MHRKLDSRSQKKIISEIKRIENREKFLKRILIESVKNNRPLDPRIIQEIGFLQKVKQKLDKAMDSVKGGTRKAYNKFEDILAAARGEGVDNMEKIIKQFDLEDSQASALEDYIDSMSGVAKKFMDLLSKLNKEVKQFEFPNTDGESAKKARAKFGLDEDKLDVDVFTAMLNTFVEFYGGVVASHSNGEISTEDANEIIARTRELLNTYSQELDAAYRKLENKNKKLPLINEKKLHTNKLAHLLFEATPSDAERARRTQIRSDRGTAIGSDGETKEMINNKSFSIVWKGAIAGALLGAAAGTAINSSAILDKWFKIDPSDLEQVSSAPDPQEKLQTLIEPQMQEFYQLDGSVKKGDGLTKLINRFAGTNLNPNSSVKDFVEALEKMGDGDAQAAVDGLVGSGSSKGIFIDKEAARKALNSIINNQGPMQNNTLGQLFSDHRASGGTNLLGTGKKAGDALGIQINRDFIIQKAKIASEKIINHPVVGPALKTGNTARKISKGAATLGTLGVLAPWALGGAAAGATVGLLLRHNSLKSSRAKKIQDTIQGLEDVEDKNFTLPPPTTSSTTGTSSGATTGSVTSGGNEEDGNTGNPGRTGSNSSTFINPYSSTQEDPNSSSAIDPYSATEIDPNSSTSEKPEVGSQTSTVQTPESTRIGLRALDTLRKIDREIMDALRDNGTAQDQIDEIMEMLKENKKRNIRKKSFMNESTAARREQIDLNRWSLLAGIKKN